ncbi:MAG: cysteine dioxygenase family protein [Acidobacteria bacterium]|nr:cysteine dioxygenase family protein [Acidobacteriota bacterium]MBV9147408.1 cysteine dioxygenase family protein [Acidobacteriota bacterium]MBV9435376.1 cysteine dioxygenase family protein [Acidobacteriota bacterium]
MSVAGSSIGALVSIQDFVSELRKLPVTSFAGIDEIQRFLRQHPVEPASLSPYLLWDRQHYTRNLIDKSAIYELIAICWEVGQGSSIHNHRDQNCWMAAPIGVLKVQNYRVLWQDEAQGKCNIEPTDIVEINPSNPVAVDPAEPVHKVYNPAELKQRAVSLHVYSRPFDSCVVYSDQQGTCGTIKLHYTTQYGQR